MHTRAAAATSHLAMPTRVPRLRCPGDGGTAPALAPATHEAGGTWRRAWRGVAWRVHIARGMRAIGRVIPRLHPLQ